MKNSSQSLSKFLFIFIAFIFSSYSVANGDIKKGEQLYQACISCHGDKAQGNDELNAPTLAGQYQWYLSAQLQNFKNGKRGAKQSDQAGQQMVAMANLLTDETAIADVSSFLASLDKVKTAETLPADLRNGDNKYNAVCGACHGKDAQGNENLKAPNLSILSSKYLTTQIKNYRTSSRGYHNDDKYGRQMKMMAGTVQNDADLADIVAFINTLPIK
ncbi:c-type cytochrome [Thalassotalea nanhaiensis]|uniref:C-type cytochrome n=1 Tax=Thalassotalea nanhaiensis TaxID=3065648 RepID=A0ABY9TPS6_9GAMM|nr:c-type cytochrome [Colwelliaceae bacterium SQ345]